MLDEAGRPIELGRGAMGVTYKALDVDLRCPVTLKVISERYLGDQSARLRFLREARAAAKVRHSNCERATRITRQASRGFALRLRGARARRRPVGRRARIRRALRKTEMGRPRLPSERG